MINTKTYGDIVKEMADQIGNTDFADFATGSAMEELAKAIEAGLYGGYPLHERELRRMLNKLGIKSALPGDGGFGSLVGGGPLQMESLDTVLKQVSFDMDTISKWKP